MLAAKSDPGSKVLIALASELDTTPNDLLGITGRFRVLDPDDHQHFVEEQAQALVDAARSRAREKLCAIGTYPPVKEVYKWATNCGNRIDTAEDVTRFFTTYSTPDNTTTHPNVEFVGANSLARNSLGTLSARELNGLIKKMPDEFVAGLIRDQQQLTANQPSISIEHIPVSIPEANVDVDFTYLRLYLRLQDRSGKSVILNYSEPLD